MFQLSWSQALFFGEPLEASLQRLARFGYDGVELPVSASDPRPIRELLTAFGLQCFSVNGSFIGPGRDLSSAEPEERETAVAYVGRCLEFAVEVGAETAIVVPTRIGKFGPETTLDLEWQLVVESLCEIGAAPGNLASRR